MTSSVTEGTESYGLVVVLVIVCCISIIINLLIIFLVLHKAEFRGKTEAFICNMAVSDVLLVGVAIPIKLAQTISGKKDFTGGDGACKMMMFLPMMTIMTCIYTMMFISFDRYYCVVRGKKFNKLGIVAALVAIWIVSLAFASPTFYEYSVAPEFEEEENKTEISCGSHGIPENFETIYAAIIVVVAYFLPLAVIVINYSRITSFLWKNALSVGASGDIAGTVSKRNIRITKILALITAVFAICWAPFFVLFTIEEVTDTDHTNSFDTWPHTIKVIFIVLSSISNPILYTVFNERFRSAVLAFITGGRHTTTTTSQPTAVVSDALY